MTAPWRLLTSNWLNIVLLAATVGLFTVPSPAVAGPGTGISPSKVELTDPVGQGETVHLPLFSVRNFGDEDGAFRMDVTHYTDQEQLIVGDSWIKLEPDQFTLEAGESQSIEVVMTVPEDATVGDYRILIRAAGSPATRADGGGQVSVGVAAASTISFSVKNVNFHFYDPAVDPVVDFFVTRSPFSYIGTGMLLVLLVVYLFQRRYGIAIDIGVSRKE